MSQSTQLKSARGDWDKSGEEWEVGFFVLAFHPIFHILRILSFIQLSMINTEKTYPKSMMIYHLLGVLCVALAFGFIWTVEIFPR